jgi:penicillin amidase
MKILRFLFFFSLSAAAIYQLNIPHGNIPPLGKLLNPSSGFWQNTYQKHKGENKPFHGLEQEVEVYFDQHHIPHIFAGNDHDLYFAVGYIMAGQRLWQMEFQTHYAAGRISELVGERALELDRKQRRLGSITSAEKTLQKWMGNIQVKNMLEAFTEGVNAYISELKPEDYPIEYKILDYAPEKWAPLKCALLINYMSATLNLKEYDIENTNLLKKLGPELFNMLYPDYIEESEPVIPTGTPWEFEPLPIPPSYDSIVFLSGKINPYDKTPDGIGSNNWAVHANHTQNGHALLANDMHLSYRLPSIWLQMHLNAPGVNVFGHVIPGAPLVITGFNDSIAWGITNVARDVADWYAISFRSETKEEYLYDDNWLRTQRKIEEIKIRNEDPFYDTVFYTHLGPVVYDNSFGADNERVNLALKWITHEPTSEAEAFYRLNRAENYDDFKEAISYFANPASNMAFASSEGDIAMHVQGRFPLRYQGQGRFVLDGTTSRTDWKGYIPTDHVPQILNPEKGYVSSANQTSTASDYPYYSYHTSYEFFRNKRINQVLDSLPEATPEDMMALQLDSYNVLASMALPIMLDSMPINELSETEKEVFLNLRRWDYEYSTNSKLPSYFYRWWRNFRNALWDEVKMGNNAYYYPRHNITLAHLKAELDSSFYDIVSTEKNEGLKDILLSSFQETIIEIAEWENENGDADWYKYRGTDINHMLQIDPFSYKDIMVSGGHYSVKRVDPVVGASQRLVVEMGPEIKAWSAYPGGQSGNPGSPYYDHFLKDYLNDQYIEIDFFNRPENAGQPFLDTLKLSPAL